MFNPKLKYFKREYLNKLEKKYPELSYSWIFFYKDFAINAIKNTKGKYKDFLKGLNKLRKEVTSGT